MAKCFQVTLLILCSIIFIAPADDAMGEEAWDLAITGGWNNSTLSGGAEKLLGSETLNMFNFGAALLLRVNEEVGFEFGVRFSRKGGTGTIDTTYSIPNFKNVTEQIGDAEVTLDFIEFPFLLAGMLPTGQSGYLRGYAGASLGILVNADVEGTLRGQDFEADISDLVKDIEFDIVLGASYVYEFSSWSAIGDGRYSLGLNSLDDSDLDMVLKTRTWEVSLGVLIPLAR